MNHSILDVQRFLAMALLFIKDGFLSFGGHPLFQGLDVSIDEGQKICLIGRNGCGKSTLMKVLASQAQLDQGTFFAKPGLHVSYLPQMPKVDGELKVIDYVKLGMRIQDGDEESQLYRVHRVLDSLELNAQNFLKHLSGGQLRRCDLARCLLEEGDVLLLDEPTNHLDMKTILWLEDEIKAMRRSVVVISHDRQFLKNISKQCWWLDRGHLKTLNRSFEHFESWQEQVYHDEEKEVARLNKHLEIETHWLHRGVTARRKRNQGRLRKLYDLRQQKKDLISKVGKVTLNDLKNSTLSGKIVIDADHLVKKFGERVIVSDFSTRIARGEHIGIVGPNGAGKTTLLKMLLGLLAPDSGEITMGANVKVGYFDQMRSSIDETMRLRDYLCGAGGDHVSFGGGSRHVVAYLKEFLFSEHQANALIKTLSGGEKNRLHLAKLLTQDHNLLVLDEPTNDLDVETLDLLQEYLSAYEGTVVVVSHDRDFLENFATSIIGMEGEGVVLESVGGITDYIRVRQDFLANTKLSAKPSVLKKDEKDDASVPSQGPESSSDNIKKKTKLSYKEMRELESLPQMIEDLTKQLVLLEEKLSKTSDHTILQDLSSQHHDLSQKIAMCEHRWLELEELKESFS